MNFLRTDIFASLFRLAALMVSATAMATEFTIVVLDGPGTGFNDPTPRAPVGGNPGTTLGEQRLNVLQRAGDIWASYLHSDVPILVEAQFVDYGGDNTGAVLAGASSIDIEADFANAPLAAIWYPVALANSLAGVDLEPSFNDIEVFINNALDADPPILGGWYYGFDGNFGNQVDMLDVLLHELGHGLGFISFVRISSNPVGGFFLNLPDVYSWNLYDTSTLKGWGSMTSNERKASMKNDPHLTWTGPFTGVAAGQILDPQRAILVSAPASAIGEYTYLPASFGPPVPEGGISGTLVMVNDGTAPLTDACEPIVNVGELDGNIAYIDRGSCNFDAKVLNAQQSGAIAVIIANNVTGGPVGMSGSDVVNGTTLIIPAVSISLEDGVLLAGASPGVTLILGAPSAAGLAGTDGGYIRMYAPDPLEPGSSVSHFSTAASPNLLMEPFISDDLRDDPDLALVVMKDIGWRVIDIPFPYLNYELWSQETFDPATTLIAEGDDPDNDGIANIEEYFFNGDPEVPSSAILPRMQVVDPDLELTYTRTKLAADLAYAYEVSPDMNSWMDAEQGIDFTEEVITDLGASAEQVRLKLVPPVSGAKIFVRLRVTIP